MEYVIVLRGAGLWLRSGYRGGRVSETIGNALA